MKETIGQRVLAAVLSYQLGITVEGAMKRHIRGRQIHPSWEVIGEELLKHSPGPSAAPAEKSVAKKNADRSVVTDRT